MKYKSEANENIKFSVTFQAYKDNVINDFYYIK